MIHWRTNTYAALSACFALFFSFVVVHAATTDSFTVTQSIVDPDNEPPTTPTNLTATPVASTQIDLSWDASSDNVAVSGYQIYRDAVAIATTSLTSYSDTGLTASTSYDYNVSAFDTSSNYSTTSATTSTTTLPTPPPPPPATSTPPAPDDIDSATQLLFIRDLNYNATQNTIDISFDTTRYARAIIRWGRTENYEGGFISSDTYRNRHQSAITGLNAGTVYEIEVLVADQSGRYEDRETLTVRTKAGADTVPPTNATDFVAELIGDEVALSWTNPDDDDFSHVRVLSSDRFYPTHPADGWFVYEGKGETVRDGRPLAEGKRRYYTIFSYDEAGNTSSGAVTFVTRGSYEPPSQPSTETFERPGSGVGISPTTSTTSVRAAPQVPSFEFDDLVFVQDGEERPTVGGEVELMANENTVVSLPYELVPEHLKTIVVTLEHPDAAEHVFSFLLRINPDKTAYEAHIGPLREAGTYRTNVSLFDYATEELFGVDGVVVVDRSPMSAALDTKRVTSIGATLSEYRLPLSLFGGMLILLLLVFAVRRSRRREKMFVPGSTR